MMNFLFTVLATVISALIIPTAALLINQISDDRRLSRAIKTYRELEENPDLHASRVHLQQYIEHETPRIFQSKSSRKWTKRAIFLALVFLSIPFLTLAIANDIQPLPLWYSLIAVTAVYLGIEWPYREWLYQDNGKVPQLNSAEQEKLESANHDD